MLPVLTADEKIGRYKYFCFALSLPVALASVIHTLAHIFLRQIDLCYLFFFFFLEILISDPQVLFCRIKRDIGQILQELLVKSGEGEEDVSVKEGTSVCLS